MNFCKSLRSAPAPCKTEPEVVIKSKIILTSSEASIFFYKNHKALYEFTSDRVLLVYDEYYNKTHLRLKILNARLL